MSSTSARKSLWDPSVASETSSASAEVQPERVTRQILRTANEINATADGTLADLDAQGKKIAKAQDGVARINDHMTGADRLISEIGSWWTMFAGKFRSEPNKTEHQTRRSQWEQEHQDKMTEYRARDEFVRGVSSAPQTKATSPSDFEDDVEADLDEIHTAVIEMRRKAVLMGAEIEDHNHRLDHLASETDFATHRVRNAKNNIGAILRK